MNTADVVHPVTHEPNQNGQGGWAQCGITQRLHIAVEITKALIQARPREVMNPEELINEAFQYADILMDRQHSPTNP